MRRAAKILCLVEVLLVVTMVVAQVAKASYDDPRLDAVASAVAGHPVVVQCAVGSMEWADTERGAGLTFEADGFTFIGRDNVVYLAPGICDTLEADFRYGPTVVGDWANGRAIKTILHEATHQAGVADEAVTDCNAVSLVKQYAPAFGYATTVVRTSYVKVRDGHYRRVIKTVPNPALASLAASALAWHRLMPPAYQGAC